VIRHRLPLRSKLSPLLFGRSIGWVFGLLLTPDRGQMIFLSQAKVDTFDMRRFGRALKTIRGASQNRAVEPRARMVSGNGSAGSWLKMLRRLQTAVVN